MKNTIFFLQVSLRKCLFALGLPLLFLSLFTLQMSAQDYTGVPETPSPAIRLNQVGFYPFASKLAVICNDSAQDFVIYSADLANIIYSGKLSATRTSTLSGKKTRIADFSKLKTTGKYVLVIPGVGRSYPLEINHYIHEPLAKAALKAFYYQRMSTTLPAKYAGKWERGLSHPDKKVLVHPSAASEGRPAGTVIASPGGWYDAGDYNKYIVNSGITMATLMSLYEDFPTYFDTLNINIPESKNKVADLLDEVLYNLRWMLTMQDPADGGVYHKCTTAEFEGFIKPEDAREKRYVVQKSTAAALDFAAVMAQAARIYGKMDKQLPGLADSCRTAAQKAWQWAAKNPQVYYDQTALNKAFDPDINTGAYDDKHLEDELFWASAELYVTTGDSLYLNAFRKGINQKITVPSWSDVHSLGVYTLLRARKQLATVLGKELNLLRTQLITYANAQAKSIDTYAYHTAMENTPDNFVWGSNAVAANQGVLFLQAFRLTGEHPYIEKALDNLDYLLGRNATGYSYVTGFGYKTPMHPHHRPSETDKVKEPVPGLLAGGPNPGQQDKCTTYTSKIYDESYTDNVQSYASNEVAINWNAPLVYLAFFIDVILK